MEIYPAEITERVLAVFSDGQPRSRDQLLNQVAGADSTSLWLALAMAVSRNDLRREGELYFPSQQLLQRLGGQANAEASVSAGEVSNAATSIWDDAAVQSVPVAVGEKRRAEDWLRELLQEPRLADEVKRLATDAGICFATLRRAKQAVGAISIKTGGYFGGDGRWRWRLPEDAH